MSLVFAVMELVDIILLNVTETVVETETLAELSVGLPEDTGGAMTSVDNEQAVAVVNPLGV